MKQIHLNATKTIGLTLKKVGLAVFLFAAVWIVLNVVNQAIALVSRFCDRDGVGEDWSTEKSKASQT